MYRQGDVLLIPVAPNSTPHGAEVLREGGRLILAKGEATGHHHSLASKAAALYMLAGGAMLLKLASRAKLAHQEHAPVWLPPGDYIVRRQREYRWGESRQVAD